MTTAIRPLPPRSRPGLGVSAPSPAMMRRRINPQLVPLRDGDITTTPRPTTAAGAEAVLATIHVDAAVTTTAAIACGELRVSFPGLDDWVVNRVERDRHECPGPCPERMTPQVRQAFVNARYAALSRRVIDARAQVAVELAQHVAAVQAVHGPVVVDIPDATVAAAIGQLPLGLEPFMGHLGVVSQARRNVFQSVGAGLAESVAHIEGIEADEVRNKEPLRIAADASRGRRGAAGIAWISAEGRHVSRMVNVDEVAAAEFLAIKFAIDDAVSREPERKIIIHSDSRHALGALSGKWVPQWATGKLLSHLNRARATIREHGIRLRWVRGHSGDTLNEIADRLAVHRRRCTECGIDEEVILERESRIVEDYFAGDQFSALDLAA